MSRLESGEPKKLTARQKELANRKAILESEEYDKWYEARRHIQPSPTNPYQAFMIDRSLRAKPYDESSWEDYVNRSDFEPIDNPQGVPIDYPEDGKPIHRKHRNPTFVPASKIRPQHENEPLFQELKGIKEDFNKTYGTDDVELIIEKRSGGSAYSRPQRPGEKGKVFVPDYLYEEIKRDPKAYKKKQFVVANVHEFSHGAHLGRGVGQYINPFDDNPGTDIVPHTEELKQIYKKTEGAPTRKIRRERMAHAVTKDYYEKKGWKLKGSAKLLDDWALGTYEGTTPKSMQRYDPQTMQPKTPKFVFDPSKQLILSAKKVRRAI